jgi:Holliday junction resolvasome RuvABC endonuclease subunit
MSSLYIGIDASLTGTAMVQINNLGEVVTELHGLGYSLPKDADVWAQADRCRIIADGIINFLSDRPHSAIEGYSFGSNGMRTLQIAELGGMVRGRILQQGWTNRPTIIPPKTLKKFACGKGNADKDQVGEGVDHNWGYRHSDDNVIDAYVLAQIMRHIDPEAKPHLPPMKQYQLDALGAIGLI